MVGLRKGRSLEEKTQREEHFDVLREVGEEVSLHANEAAFGHVARGNRKMVDESVLGGGGGEAFKEGGGPYHAQEADQKNPSRPGG